MVLPTTILIMDDRWCVLCGEGDDGQVGELAFELNTPAEQRVALLREWAESHGVVLGPVVLALASNDCLSATVSLDDLERGRRQLTLGYRLEEHLPVAAEQVVASYCEQGGAALGVCAEIEELAPTIDAFEDDGLAVHHIVPAAMLVAADLLEANGTVDFVAIQRPGDTSLDVIELSGGRPVRWYWLGGAAEAADRINAACERLGRSPVVGRIGDFPSLPVSDRHGAVEWLDHDRSYEQAMARASCRLIEGKSEAWFDLRTAELARPDRFETYRKPASVLVFGLIVLLAAIIGVSQYHGRRYAAIATMNHDAEVALFEKALPDQRVPVNIKGRLESEARKLAGLSGRGGEGVDIALLRSTSAVVHLYSLLSSLPGGMRFRILDLTVQPDEIRVTGEARSHGDAEQIAAALRDTGRYTVDAPRTQALREQDGVSFTFTATPNDSAGLAKAGQP
jgi:hypothetical protein